MTVILYICAVLTVNLIYKMQYKCNMETQFSLYVYLVSAITTKFLSYQTDCLTRCFIFLSFQLLAFE